MKVILIEEIRGLGSRGDVVSVKDGYARNYLFPKSLAREATTGNLKSVEQEKKKWAVLSEKEKEVAQKAAKAVQGVKITIHKRTGDRGQLFGSVTANEIADALEAKGVEVDKRRIELAHPIKSTGIHEVDVRLHKEVTAHLKVEVLPIGVESVEEQPAPAAAPAETEAPVETEA